MEIPPNSLVVGAAAKVIRNNGAPSSSGSRTRCRRIWSCNAYMQSRKRSRRRAGARLNRQLTGPQALWRVGCAGVRDPAYHSASNASPGAKRTNIPFARSFCCVASHARARVAGCAKVDDEPRRADPRKVAASCRRCEPSLVPMMTSCAPGAAQVLPHDGGGRSRTLQMPPSIWSVLHVHVVREDEKPSRRPFARRVPSGRSRPSRNHAPRSRATRQGGVTPPRCGAVFTRSICTPSCDVRVAHACVLRFGRRGDVGRAARLDCAARL